MLNTINLKRLIAAIAIPELVGAASAFITGNMGEAYQSYNRPPLSPPGIVFPIVWVILYALMGIASYLVLESKTASSEDKKEALILYAVQLGVNFIWPIIFFMFEAYTLAAVVIIALLVLVVITAFKFRKINITAFRLMIPYILWLIFATYLNIGVAVLN